MPTTTYLLRCAKHPEDAIQVYPAVAGEGVGLVTSGEHLDGPLVLLSKADAKRLYDTLGAYLTN